MKPYNDRPLCRECQKAREEPWARGRMAIHCEGPGRHRGWVVDKYRDGARELANERAPAWCPKMQGSD